MRRASILGILFDLLGELSSPGPLPADARVGRFLRARRYLGAQDRRTLTALAYGWLRHRLRGEARWDAWAARAGLPGGGGLLEGKEGPLPVLVALARDSLLPWSVEELITAAREQLHPPESWATLLARMADPDALGTEDWPAEPLLRLSAELALPNWMAARLLAERGEEETRALGSALLQEAPVDLRVNLSRISRDRVRLVLEGEIDRPAEPTPWSPLGLRLPGRFNLRGFQAHHAGWIEVQEEGSQLVALCTDLRSGELAIDACAGAGGKTLALRDLLRQKGGRGKIHACDINSGKLDELRRRSGDPGIQLELHPIKEDGPLPDDLPGQVDLVLLDVPCSGSGTLRRSPDLKYRYGPDDITRFSSLQGAILRRFSPRVRPGGRIVYSTCSLFREENEDVIESFLRDEPGYRQVPSDWADQHLPAPARRDSGIYLDPITTGTDCFFVAILARV